RVADFDAFVSHHASPPRSVRAIAPAPRQRSAFGGLGGPFGLPARRIPSRSPTRRPTLHTPPRRSAPAFAFPLSPSSPHSAVVTACFPPRFPGTSPLSSLAPPSARSLNHSPGV